MDILRRSGGWRLFMFPAKPLTSVEGVAKMKKFFESSFAVFTIIFYIAVIWGEFGGLYHTYTRHRDQFWLAVFVPPISWYMGVEMFWHKEYSGKRWEKTLANDARTIYQLLNSSAVGSHPDQGKLDEEIDSFSNKVAKYPKKNRAIIKTVYDDISQYQLALYDDSDEMMSRYTGPDSLVFTKSDKTKQLEKKLIGYGLGDYITFGNDNLWEPMAKMLKDKISEFPSGEEASKYVIGLRDAIKLRKEASSVIIKTVSRKIFE
jgi:hypothetical protein